VIKQTGSRLFTVLSLTILLSACYNKSASEPLPESPASENHVPSMYLVTLSKQLAEQAIETLFAQYGVRELKRVDTQLYQVTLTNDPGLQRLQELAAESDLIRHIQPNNIYRKN